MEIDFDALHTFVTVVEKGGFNAAAEALFKTQPAITLAVKKLENRLNLCLFDRSHYRPQLTPQGEKLYKRAKSLVSHWRHLNEFSQQLGAGMESDITIAIDVFYPLNALKELLRHWINTYPLTQFHFLSESLGGACERLLRQQADLVISENLISDRAVEMIVLRSEPMVAVASPRFVEQFAEKLHDLDDLSDCMQVILRDSSQSDFTFGVLEHGRRWTVSDVHAKKDIILAGLGWGRLPLHLVAKELAHGSLQRLIGPHIDERLLTMGAIRLQKPAHTPIVERLWADLHTLKQGAGCSL